ncbi:hypothetical protein Z957_04065 [Clostridium sp. K25]|uniref:dihydroxyacetone kinase subunit DhaL n=1 Tax=Clostridium sp. K25 TaxID=1443109 RepID=UPI0004D7D567|nr:hypothetical protein Z957_04065 [Clostridium sp. K25]
MGNVNLIQMKKSVKIIADIIIKNEVLFCELDSVAGDGDFGMSVAKGFKELLKQWENLSDESISKFLKDCSMIITEYCGGASGPIWGSAFRSASKYTKDKEELNAEDISGLFAAGIQGIQKRGSAKLGDKTLLDALIPAYEAMNSCKDKSIIHMLKEGAKAARKGAEKTKEIVALKGRASYVGERSVNYPDAGAMAIAIIFETALKM